MASNYACLERPHLQGTITVCFSPGGGFARLIYPIPRKIARFRESDYTLGCLGGADCILWRRERAFLHIGNSVELRSASSRLDRRPRGPERRTRALVESSGARQREAWPDRPSAQAVWGDPDGDIHVRPLADDGMHHARAMAILRSIGHSERAPCAWGRGRLTSLAT